MPPLDAVKLKEKLENLKSLQSEIVGLATWCYMHSSDVKSLVKCWCDSLYDKTDMQKLNLMYLVNEMVQSKKKERQKFVSQFADVMPEALNYLIESVQDQKIKLKIVRVVLIWEQRQIFSTMTTKQLISIIQPYKGQVNIAPSKPSSSQPPTNKKQVVQQPKQPAVDEKLMPIISAHQKVEEAALSSRQWTKKAMETLQSYKELLGQGSHQSVSDALRILQTHTKVLQDEKSARETLTAQLYTLLNEQSNKIQVSDQVLVMSNTKINKLQAKLDDQGSVPTDPRAAQANTINVSYDPRQQVMNPTIPLVAPQIPIQQEPMPMSGVESAPDQQIVFPAQLPPQIQPTPMAVPMSSDVISHSNTFNMIEPQYATMPPQIPQIVNIEPDVAMANTTPHTQPTPTIPPTIQSVPPSADAEQQKADIAAVAELNAALMAQDQGVVQGTALAGGTGEGSGGDNVALDNGEIKEMDADLDEDTHGLQATIDNDTAALLAAQLCESNDAASELFDALNCLSEEDKTAVGNQLMQTIASATREGQTAAE